MAGGISSLYWGKAAWDHVSGVISPVASALAPILPTGGWRIYTISGHMPVFDPATWRLKIGGLVEQPVSLTYDELRALPRVEQVSNFHCVTGWTREQRPLGRRPDARRPRRRQAAASRRTPSSSSRWRCPTSTT